MQIESIELSRIEPNPRNPRRTIKPETLQELADSIKAQGLLQPITVRVYAKSERRKEVLYQIVLGERRYRASELAGLETIDCIVRDMTDREVMEAMLVENLQRVDVDPIEEARYVSAALCDGWTPAEVAARLGKSAKWVAIRIQISGMADEIIELLKDGKIGVAHVQALAQVKDPELRLQLASSAAEDKMTVSELHAEIQKHQRKLADAPWKMNVKLGKCPACLGCQERSDRQGDLFGGEKAALCLNSECWKEKLEAHKEALKKKLEGHGRKVEIAQKWEIHHAENGWGGYTNDEEEIKKMKEAGVEPRILIDENGATIEAYKSEDMPEEDAEINPEEDAEAQAERERLDRERRIDKICDELILGEIVKKLENQDETVFFDFLADAIIQSTCHDASDLEEIAGHDDDGIRNEIRHSNDVAELKLLRSGICKWIVSVLGVGDKEIEMFHIDQKKFRKKAEKQIQAEANDE